VRNVTRGGSKRVGPSGRSNDETGLSRKAAWGVSPGRDEKGGVHVSRWLFRRAGAPLLEKPPSRKWKGGVSP